MNTSTILLAYTYFKQPWSMSTGDEVRVHAILSNLAKSYKVKIIVFNISPFVESYELKTVDNVTYVTLPKRFYALISRITRWNRHYDYNPLMKITHYIDEFLVAYKLRGLLSKSRILMVFGTMSLFSFMLRCQGARKPLIIYDPLANYTQTLYIVSRKNFLEVPRYGLYLVLHKLEIRAADIVVYPSRIDLENAQQMLKPKKAIVIPNPTPVCYESTEEYMKYRSQRTDYDRLYFILLAGGRWRANEETVKITIEIFNKLPPEKFKLIITGPWQDMKKYVKNSSIELLGVVPKDKLKEPLAISDYGLSPVFTHQSGTFLKTLAYAAAGLDIIASPHGLVGINLKRIKSKIYLVRSEKKFEETVRRLVSEWKGERRNREALTCDEALTELKRSLEEALKTVAR